MRRREIEVPDVTGLLECRPRRRFLRDLAGWGEGTDLGILTFALSLEYMQAQLYAEALESGLLSRLPRSVVATLLAHERAHIDALVGILDECGGTPVSEPAFAFPADVYASENSMLEHAAAFEAVSAGACLGAAPLLRNPDFGSAVQGLAGIEREHFVATNLLLGTPFSAGSGLCAALFEDAFFSAVEPLADGIPEDGWSLNVGTW